MSLPRVILALAAYAIFGFLVGMGFWGAVFSLTGGM